MHFVIHTQMNVDVYARIFSIYFDFYIYVYFQIWITLAFVCAIKTLTSIDRYVFWHKKHLLLD